MFWLVITIFFAVFSGVAFAIGYTLGDSIENDDYRR